jgi:hypothetical protein
MVKTSFNYILLQVNNKIYYFVINIPFSSSYTEMRIHQLASNITFTVEGLNKVSGSGLRDVNHWNYSGIKFVTN